MIELEGVPGTTPIGFMAALGLLRVLGEDRELPVRLSWDHATPRLHGLEDRDELLKHLVAQMQGRHRDVEWTWAKTVKGNNGVQPEAYAQACREAEAKSERPERALAFLAGWATDASVNEKGAVRYTRLDLTSGKQRLIDNLRAVAASLESTSKAQAAFETALFGGPFEHQSSFGWDPSAIRQHAHEARAPTSLKRAGKRGWIWLAAESLAWHPVLPDAGRTRTTGCEAVNEGGMAYFWGLWSADAELGPGEARMLRALDFRSLARRPGVESLWTSTIAKSGNYSVLLPARRVHPPEQTRHSGQGAPVPGR